MESFLVRNSTIGSTIRGIVLIQGLPAKLMFTYDKSKYLAFGIDLTMIPPAVISFLDRN